MLKWSPNITYGKPLLLAPDQSSLRNRAYPYADSPEPKDTNEPYIRVSPNEVTFIGQRGPVKEHGVNGCQIDDILTFVLGVLRTFNKIVPSRENSLAVTKLEECLHWLDARTRDRENRGVEGRNAS